VRRFDRVSDPSPTAVNAAAAIAAAFRFLEAESPFLLYPPRPRLIVAVTAMAAAAAADRLVVAEIFEVKIADEGVDPVNTGGRGGDGGVAGCVCGGDTAVEAEEETTEGTGDDFRSALVVPVLLSEADPLTTAPAEGAGSCWVLIWGEKVALEFLVEAWLGELSRSWFAVRD